MKPQFLLAFSACYLLQDVYSKSIWSILPQEAPIFDPKAPTHGNANKFLDKLFINLGEFLIEEKFDPLTVPGYQYDFQAKAGFIDAKGSIKGEPGKVYGLGTLHRAGNCSLFNRGKDLVLQAFVGIKNLKYNAKTHVQFMLPFDLKDMSATLDYISAFAEIAVPLEGLVGLKPKVNAFFVKDLGEIKVTFSNNAWPFNWIYGQIGNKIIGEMKHKFKAMVEPLILKLANEMIAKIPG